MSDAYIVKLKNGYARLYNGDDSFVRDICDRAVGAEMKGNEVHVTRRNKTMVFSLNGIYLKTIEDAKREPSLLFLPN